MISLVRFLIILLVFIVYRNYSYADIMGFLSDKEQFLLDVKADEVGYDFDDFTIEARGNVFVAVGDKGFNSDYAKYNRDTGYLKIDGNIHFYYDKNFIMVDTIESHNNFTDINLHNFYLKFANKSVIKGKEALRKEKHLFAVNHIYYTPCPVCQNVRKAPMIGVYAGKAIIDELDQQVLYRDVFLKLYGKTVMYLPFFSHHLQKVKSKSGFLVPSYLKSNILGDVINLPFYFNIKPNIGMKVTPSYSFDEGAAVDVSFNHLLKKGSYVLKGSMRNVDKSIFLIDKGGESLYDGDAKELRWHFKGEGDILIGDNWNFNFDIARASDDLYMEKYYKKFDTVLTSLVHFDRLDDRNYINLESIFFQELDEDKNKHSTPDILPYMNFHYETEPGEQGIKLALDGGFLSIYRELGIGYKRSSVQGSAYIPYISETGLLFELKTALRLDNYIVEDKILFVDDKYGTENTIKETDYEIRLVPEVMFKLSYPLVSYFDNYTIFIEPIFTSVFRSHDKNAEDIPNEDSKSFEFTDFNVFDSTVYFGIDRVEEGARLSYGFRIIFDSLSFGNLEFLFGQSYMTTKDNNFIERSGLESNFSDYVGKLSYIGLKEFNHLSYSFQIDSEGELLRYSLKEEIDFKNIEFELNYLFDETYFQPETGSFIHNKLFLLNTDFRINDNLKVGSSFHYDIENGDWIKYKLSANYDMNCVSFSVEFSKTFIEDREIQPDTLFSFSVTIKNF